MDCRQYSSWLLEALRTPVPAFAAAETAFYAPLVRPRTFIVPVLLTSVAVWVARGVFAHDGVGLVEYLVAFLLVAVLLGTALQRVRR
jgi:hypothetical protein